MIHLLNSNALHIPLADQTVQCVITSPPYWNLRDYNVKDQIGLEATPAEYVAHIVAAMRECWRVLRDDGVMWLNLGDSYARQAGPEERKFRTSYTNSTGHRTVMDTGNSPSKKNVPPDGLKPKDLMGIPWRVAFALQADGWYLRSDIIWHKPNPMPESVTDRPTKSHEYIFLLAKQERYYYDAEAIKETSIYPEGSREDAPQGSFNGKNGDAAFRAIRNTRNRRSVWTVATESYSGSHFATFPTKLVEPMILAGTSPQACEHCGAPWERVIEHKNGEIGIDTPKDVSRNEQGLRTSTRMGHGAGWRSLEQASTSTIGWHPTCTCENNTGAGRCLVLDPFAGTATVGRVAIKHGRRFVGLDLNTAYIELAHERTSKVQIVMPM